MRHVVWSIASLLCLTLLAAAPGYDWQKPQAKVLPTGDLAWQPTPFRYTPGKIVRYIDYAHGNDDNPGTQAKPWKHHPWDPHARGHAARARGPITYVFKRGVIYRGHLIASESGTADQPIRLTSDPGWGQGQAIITGANRVTGWHHLRSNGSLPPFPARRKIWAAHLNFAPRAVYLVDGQRITRLHLARTPNWTITDPNHPMSQWWQWTNPRWWKNHHDTRVRGKKMHLGIDPKHLTRSASYYVGAYVWTEWGIVMGTPYPARVRAFKPKQHAIAFQGPWGGASERIIAGNRYYLEDKPQYLDQGGEFWFDKHGRGGTLYLRLPHDADPRKADVEAADRLNLIDLANVSHVHITGLTFRFNNLDWHLNDRFWQSPNVQCAAIHCLGGGHDITISHCRFTDVSQAIRIAVGKHQHMDHIRITDNDIDHTDHLGIDVTAGGKPGAGTLGDVQVLRNRLRDIGGRAIRPNGNQAMRVAFPQTAQIAGNIINHCYGPGIFVFGGKASGAQGIDVPLSRILIHDNKVTNSLIAACDWGGIETWQGGPFYVYDNISGNPVGPMHWAHKTLGFAYYFDGSFKNYIFNNIAWGEHNNPQHKMIDNTAAFQEVLGYDNVLFNNTAYRFLQGSRRQGSEAGRNQYLGNIFQNISQIVFGHSKAKTKHRKHHDIGKQASDYNYQTDGYANNIFYHITGTIGAFQSQGWPYHTVAAFRAALEKVHTLASNLGVMATTPPLKNAAAHDFRPVPGSAAIGRGVKVFVPWALYQTVGEWNFACNHRDPSRIIDNHWSLTPYDVGRKTYHTRPTYPLHGHHITAANYVAGPLENWTRGALTLNGTNQYLSITNAKLTKPFRYEYKGTTHLVTGDNLLSPRVNRSNFLIETYLRIKPAQHSGVIIGKMDHHAGWALQLNRAGHVQLDLLSGRYHVRLIGSAVDDGHWHHLIAQVDRSTQTATIYLDGKTDATASHIQLPPEASLTNGGNLIVGRHLVCTIDFLRLSLGTLADAHTTIGELYAWEFHGPFLRDFTGRPAGPKRAAGAIDLH